MAEKQSRINAIFIFDLNRVSDLDHPSDKEVQMSKLLYYHPEDRNIDDKLSHFGLIEGLIALSKNYTEDKLEFIRSKLYTTTVVTWFESVYLAVVFHNNPVLVEEKDEYSYHWRNNMLKTILNNAIKMFEMFYGKLEDNLVKIRNDEMTLESLQNLLDSFLVSFMNNSTKSTLHLLKDVKGFKKLHTNVPLTLDIQLMIDDLYHKFEAISKSMLIYNQQVIHSTLDTEEMFLIYSYIVRYHGEVSREKSLTVKFPENNELSILDSQEDQLYSPQIYVNQKKYTLTILATGVSVLILLLDTNDPLIVLNSIYEYISKLKVNLLTLEEKLSKLPVLTNTKFFALNRLSKSINSVGFENLNAEMIEQLSIIYDLHSMINNSRDQLLNAHVKTKTTWVNTKYSNSREVHYVNGSNNNKSSLSESKLHFEKFVNTYFNGIYFI
ncbi:hypothetical protein MACK_002972 [Theileria orientalis]|uniref:CCZ1/INTU/HSP4 first Longin domain-containing protein n=1 Tax=Theileria orientalis TaxID=68886 RepID=A0A976ME94_THEOR|nr:hypothetical protein MACK_002972 [Theileria orientalis]